MKKMLNTLYVNRQKSYLHKERETVVIKVGKEKIGQFPILNVANILCFGQVSVSPFLLGHCAERGVGIAFYTEFGRFLARVLGRQSGNVLLRRAQYRWADDHRGLKIAKNIVAAKVANSRTVLQRHMRNHGKNVSINRAIEKLLISKRRVKKTPSLAQMMGMEGEAAASYFAVFNEMILPNNIVFSGRVRRPSTDPVNALLSFVYSLISQECLSALSGVGLDPYVGFLHADRPGRPSLALDMLEEFRASWADRFVLTLLNRQQIKENDFIQESSGAVRLKDTSRKVLLTAYQERKQDKITHPYLQENITIGMLPHCQAMLLARHIRGDIAEYPPYVLK